MKLVIEFTSKKHAKSWAETFLAASDACETHAEICDDGDDDKLAEEWREDTKRLRSLSHRITRMIKSGGDQ